MADAVAEEGQDNSPPEESLLSQAWKRIRFHTQELFRLDGEVYGIKRQIADMPVPDFGGMIEDMKRWVRTNMAHWNDESPPPDPERDRRSLNDIIDVAARLGAQRATVEINSRHDEGGNGGRNGGDKASWKDKVVWPLAVAAIVGAVVTYAKVGSLETTIRNYHEEDIRMDQQRHEEVEKRLSNLERKVFP